MHFTQPSQHCFVRIWWQGVHWTDWKRYGKPSEAGIIVQSPPRFLSPVLEQDHFKVKRTHFGWQAVCKKLDTLFFTPNTTLLWNVEVVIMYPVCAEDTVSEKRITKISKYKSAVRIITYALAYVRSNEANPSFHLCRVYTWAFYCGNRVYLPG